MPSLGQRNCTDFSSNPKTCEEMEKTAARTEEEDDMSIRKAVKGLLFGGWEEKEAAAAAIRDLAKREMSKKRALAELGVVPPLVSMLVEAKEGGCRRLALEVLVELANGSFTNKVLIVDSGLLTKLPLLQTKIDPSTKQALTPLLLSISSLAKTQFPVNSLPILSFLLDILGAAAPPTDTAILTSTTTLYNLSTQLDNAKSIISAGTVHLLLNLCFHTRAAEAALATLANLVLTEAGKKAIEDDSLVPEVFMEVMARDEEPKCQEHAAYLLMVLAGRSAAQRQRMVEMGVVELLLEVGLMGRSRLLRDRALRMLRWFKDERNGEIGGGHSGPQVGGLVLEEEGDVKRSRRRIRCLVKQSLDRNMESILRRGGQKNCSGLKALDGSSSYKSLP